VTGPFTFAKEKLLKDLHLAFAFVVLSSLTLNAQNPAPTQQLQDIADRVKVALQHGDLDGANRLALDLMSGIAKQRKAVELSPQDRLAKLEQAAPASGTARFYALAGLAKAAFDAGELDKAERYARELLSDAPVNPKDWNYGNAIFHGNTVIGRVALRRDKNLVLARTSLLAAAETAGSPQLNSFGPNMSLAKDLLAAGERETVLEFFTRCATFWKMHRGKLDEWSATVRGGGIPEFGANLLY
jgi:tetratricopeptide (TPR) repeat protein